MDKKGEADGIGYWKDDDWPDWWIGIGRGGFGMDDARIAVRREAEEGMREWIDGRCWGIICGCSSGGW